MSTYAENSADRERAARKKAQDAHIDKVTRACDADVAANTSKRGEWKRMKYERASFTVVTASEAYRKGWDEIFGKSAEGHSDSQGDSTDSDAVREASAASSEVGSGPAA